MLQKKHQLQQLPVIEDQLAEDLLTNQSICLFFIYKVLLFVIIKYIRVGNIFFIAFIVVFLLEENSIKKTGFCTMSL